MALVALSVFLLYSLAFRTSCPNCGFVGPVIFLEEDHYVAEDFLYVLSLMQAKAKSVCAKCNILSLGTYLKTFNYYSYNVNKVAMTSCIGVLESILINSLAHSPTD